MYQNLGDLGIERVHCLLQYVNLELVEVHLLLKLQVLLPLSNRQIPLLMDHIMEAGNLMTKPVSFCSSTQTKGVCTSSSSIWM